METVGCVVHSEAWQRLIIIVSSIDWREAHTHALFLPPPSAPQFCWLPLQDLRSTAFRYGTDRPGAGARPLSASFFSISRLSPPWLSSCAILSACAAVVLPKVLPCQAMCQAVVPMATCTSMIMGGPVMGLGLHPIMAGRVGQRSKSRKDCEPHTGLGLVLVLLLPLSVPSPLGDRSQPPHR